MVRRFGRDAMSLVVLVAGVSPVALAQADAGVAAVGAQVVEDVVVEMGATPAGRTVVVKVEPTFGRPLEREPLFATNVPSYARAMAKDRELRWGEAATLHQSALTEVAAAMKFAPHPLWDQAGYKVDLERRRSQVLAHGASELAPRGDDRPRAGDGARAGGMSRLPALDRARLLRLKLMSVRAATGSVPGGLASATRGALQLVLHTAQRQADRAGDPETRLLLCATRAAAGDRPGARLELAHVSLKDRSDPARALALATCQAALRQDDEALASLAVAIHRLGPSSRFLPHQTRELQSSNDWDILRRDPRFDRLFR